MKVLVVGGGSGGHITPAVAVIREILEKRPRTKVEFWTDRKYYKNVVKLQQRLGCAGEVKQKESRTIYSGAENCGREVSKVCWLTVKDWFENWWIVLAKIWFLGIL